MKTKTIVFIVGAGHSGSTLLSKALNSHSKVFSLSEISNFEEDIVKEFSICGCGQNIHDCQFWERINQKLINLNGFGIKQHPRLYNLKRDKHTFYHKFKYYVERNLAINLNFFSNHFRTRLDYINDLYEVVFNDSGSEVIVDSSKTPNRAYLIKKYLQKNYNIKVIHLVRDGRAVIYSYLKGFYRVVLKNSSSGEFEKKTFIAEKKRDIDEAISIWIKDNAKAEKYHNSFFYGNNNYFLQTYEKFANNPKEELKNIIEFIGFSYEVEMLNLNRFQNHMVSGNASRINASEIQRPYSKWKNSLTDDQIQYFNLKAKKLNQKYGFQ